MKFFVPHADDEAQAERVFEAVRKHASEVAFPATDNRIYSVTYVREGKTHTATVGERDTLTGQEVIVILRPMSDQHPYMVCTATRGVVEGGPILIGAPKGIEFFDDWPEA